MPYMGPDSEIPTKGKGSKLSPKQEAFVKEYLISLNASDAVLKAGYTTRNKNRMGAELLRHPLIRKHIEIEMNKRRERMELTADYVLTKLISIVESTESGNPQAALRGLELLGKHLGMYKERQEISGPDGEAIKMEQKVREDVADFTNKLTRLVADRGAGEVINLTRK